MKNKKVARILDRIADFMEMKGDFFRMKAYQRAAHTLDTLPEDIEVVNAEGRLEELPGVGKHIADKIQEIVETGSLQYFENLKKEYPVDFDGLMSVEGLGPKTIKLLYDELGVQNIDDLEHEAQRHHIRRLKGMGDKKEKKILENIEFARKDSGRKFLAHILPLADALKSKLESLDITQQVEIAGSIRRRKETVGDIDILVISQKPLDVMDYFTSMDMVEEIVVKGPLKSTVRLNEGIECDLRVFEEDIFGAALMYFTGSRELNVEMRKRAISQGMKLSEYGLFNVDKARKQEERLAGRTENEIFQALGLDYIEPELRENRGELKAAQEGKLPHLIEYGDIKGDLHIHSKWSDGKNSLQEMVDKAREKNYEYLAITDHSTLQVANGMDESNLRKQMDEIDKLNDEVDDLTLLKGLEVNMASDGTLDMSNDILQDLDIVVASIHYDYGLDFFMMTDRIIKAMENEYVNIIAHPTGRKIHERREYDLDLDKIFEASQETNTFLEINSQPKRLDLRDIYIKRALDVGCKLVINSDAHSKEGMNNMDIGIATARRGWSRKKDIINTMDLKQILKLF